MRLSMRRVTIVTLGVFFIIGSAFSAPKKSEIDSKKKSSEDQTLKSTATKIAPVKTSDRTKDPIQSTDLQTETATATVIQPAQNPDELEIAPNTTSGVAAAYSINWFVIAAGGTKGSSTNYNVNGTAGQTAVGMGSSTNYGINAGFWQNFGGGGGGCCVGTRGDVDGNGSVTPNILDLNFIVNYIFRFSGNPGPCPEESDVNGSGGSPNILDLNTLVNYIFRFGPLPPACP